MLAGSLALSILHSYRRFPGLCKSASGQAQVYVAYLAAQIGGITTKEPFSAPSFVSKGDHRVDIRSAGCGDEAGSDGDQQQQQRHCCKRDRINGVHAIQG